MDVKTRLFVEENGSSIYASYRRGEQPGEDERWCLHQAWRFLEIIDQSPGSAELIAMVMKLTANTVFEYAGALEASGVPIMRSPLGNNKHTGRPITIFSLKS